MEHQGKRTWVDPLGSSWESPVLSLPLFVALQLGISGRKLLAEAVSVPDPAPLAQDLCLGERKAQRGNNAHKLPP